MCPHIFLRQKTWKLVSGAICWYLYSYAKTGLHHAHLMSSPKEEVGRQHQGMDRPGVPEGSGEQGKMEKTGCKIICGAPTTLAVKGLMMMMSSLARHGWAEGQLKLDAWEGHQVA